MGLETGTYIQDLVATNPTGTDLRSVGDDHLRLLKTVLRNTFPNASKAHYFPGAVTKTTHFSVLASEENMTFLVNTTAGYVSATLPVLGSGDAGWTCYLMRVWTGGLWPLYIYPPSGLLQSGELINLAYCRRNIVNGRTTALWTGASWILSRVPSVPIGTQLDYAGSALPTGYEWPNGQSLASADYPEWYSLWGTATTPDSRGRVTAGNDTMGGASADRLSVYLNGDNDWAGGGLEYNQLSTANLPPYTPAGYTDWTGDTVSLDGGVTDQFNLISGGLVAGSNSFLVAGPGHTLGVTGSVAVPGRNETLTGTAQGGTQSIFSVLQPTIIMKKILVVE